MSDDSAMRDDEPVRDDDPVRSGDPDRDAVDRAFAELVAGYHLTAERPEPPPWDPPVPGSAAEPGTVFEPPRPLPDQEPPDPICPTRPPDPVRAGADAGGGVSTPARHRRCLGRPGRCWSDGSVWATRC